MYTDLGRPGDTFAVTNDQAIQLFELLTTVTYINREKYA